MRRNICWYTGGKHVTKSIVSKRDGMRRPHRAHGTEGCGPEVHISTRTLSTRKDDTPHACKHHSTLHKSRRCYLPNATARHLACTMWAQCTATHSCGTKELLTSRRTESKCIGLEANMLFRSYCDRWDNAGIRTLPNLFFCWIWWPWCGNIMIHERYEGNALQTMLISSVRYIAGNICFYLQIACNIWLYTKYYLSFTERSFSGLIELLLACGTTCELNLVLRNYV